MQRLNSTLLLFVLLISSCTTQKDFIPFDRAKLEKINNTTGCKYLNSFDNKVLTRVLQKYHTNYTIKDGDVYIEKSDMGKKNFFENISKGIANELTDGSIPEGYVLFKYRKLNLVSNRYETRSLDELDTKLLPTVVTRNGFKSIVINNCVYVEKELIDDQDLLGKAIDMLDYERGDKPNPYPFPYPYPPIPH